LKRIICYNENLLANAFRWHIFPLIKVLQNKSIPQDDFFVSQDSSKAEVIILPMSWNYYYKTKTLSRVCEYLKEIGSTSRPVYSFVTGDHGNKIPKNFKGYVLRASGEKSKLSKQHKGLPIFIEDPRSKYFKAITDYKRPYNARPVVGFCGFAQPLGFRTFTDLFKILLRNILSILGLHHADTQKLMASNYVRYQLLSRLQKSGSLTTNFIIRNKYRAGIKTNKDGHPTSLEFYENIKNSDYVVCMRGAGNFSNRFYETLAMGRIPVFINTDCLLPLEEVIQWKNHVVWVEYHEREKIAEKILEFHSTLNEESMNALFDANRRLWRDHLQRSSYFKTLLNEA